MRIDIAKELANCIHTMGGTVLDEALESPEFENADYWFESDDVVVELKCLSENYFSKDAFNASLSKMYQSWVHRRLVPQLRLPRQTVDLSKLPRTCTDEVVRFLRRKFDGNLKKANRQIRDTREHFGRPMAKGLLLLVSDGNYALPPGMVRHLLSKSLTNQYRCINSVIHFSVNELVESPAIHLPMDKLFWAQFGFRSRPKVEPEFLERFRTAWMSHHSGLIEDPIYEIVVSKDVDLLETMKFSQGPKF